MECPFAVSRFRSAAEFKCALVPLPVSIGIHSALSKLSSSRENWRAQFLHGLENEFMECPFTVSRYKSASASKCVLVPLPVSIGIRSVLSQLSCSQENWRAQFLYGLVYKFKECLFAVSRFRSAAEFKCVLVPLSASIGIHSVLSQLSCSRENWRAQFLYGLVHEFTESPFAVSRYESTSASKCVLVPLPVSIGIHSTISELSSSREKWRARFFVWTYIQIHGVSFRRSLVQISCRV
jgi:hypothetical protein